mmetsp:Transcript_11442/g.19349  ORF Transcript_11442/g.19349 Transcript_11442/m.19349 type:complete len:206 (+) Transcript_11442:160-777(+)
MACINKQFRIIFYPVDNSIEIVDLKSKKMFLKRIQFQQLKQQDLYVGNTLDIYGRRFKISQFADKFTQENLMQNSERTFVLIKPDSYINIGKIVDYLIVNTSDLRINNVQMLKLTEDVARELLFNPQFIEPGSQLSYKPIQNEVVRFLCSDVVVGLEIVGENSINQVLNLSGPENALNAKKEAPHSLRGLFGTDQIKNAVHCSHS